MTLCTLHVAITIQILTSFLKDGTLKQPNSGFRLWFGDTRCGRVFLCRSQLFVAAHVVSFPAPKRGSQLLSPMVVPGIKSPGSVITGSGPVSNRPDSDSPDSIIPGSTNPSSKYQYERKQTSSRRGASVSPEFVAQVHETTRQLKRRSLARRGLLDPLNSSLLLKWDIVTALALLFTATLTPFEIAFIDQAESPANSWFIVNRVVDLIFIVDMVLQFFIAYEDRRKNKAHGTGFFYTREVIWDRRRICRHYLLGSFSVDLVSILPSFLDVLPLMTQESNIGIDTRAMRALRVLRLIKLIRLMRAQRVISRVSSRIAISHTSQTLISCLVAILLASHWYACIMALQASLTFGHVSWNVWLL